MTDRTCWVIGRKTTLATNGHSHISEPFIVFESEAEALSAADMVEKVSGERPLIVEASLWKPRGSPKANGGHARAAVLSPEQRASIASKAARARWGGAPE